MGLPAKLNLDLYRGDSRIWTTTFTEDDVAVDLTGHTWLCEIRADKDRGEKVCTIEVDDTNAAAGIIVRTLTALEADNLPGEQVGQAAPVLYWDLQSTSPAGFVQTWLYGNVKVKGDASDA